MREFLTVNKTLAITNFIFSISIITFVTVHPIFVFLMILTSFSIMTFTFYKKIKSALYENLFRITQIAISIIYLRHYIDPFIVQNPFQYNYLEETFIVYNLPFIVILNLSLILFLVTNKGEWINE